MADIIKESVYPFVTHGGIHDHQCFAPGITKREYYAALAMQAMLSNPELKPELFGRGELVRAELLVDNALCAADALIAQEAKGGE